MMICMSRLILNCSLISSLLPFPIATAMNRLDVESITVLKMDIKEIILPRTEYNPKSSTPNALSANRVARSVVMALNASLTYKTSVLKAIILFVFSCIEAFFQFSYYRMFGVMNSIARKQADVEVFQIIVGYRDRRVLGSFTWNCRIVQEYTFTRK